MKIDTHQAITDEVRYQVIAMVTTMYLIYTVKIISLIKLLGQHCQSHVLHAQKLAESPKFGS